MTRNQVDAAPAAALLAALLLALLALAERAGLPLPYVKGFLIVAAVLAYVALVALSRTGRERVFIGIDGRGAPVRAGLAVAAAAWLTGEAIAPAATPVAWLGALAGAPLGIFAAHAVERLLAKRVAIEQQEPSGWLAVLAALAAAATGTLALAVGLQAAQGEIHRILGLGDAAALAAGAAVVLLPTLFGGARGALSLAGAAALGAAFVILALLVVGMGWLGPMPLPGQSDAPTLQAITEARQRWGIESPLHLAAWPSAGMMLSREALTACGVAFVTALGLSLAAAPAAQIHRRATMLSATLALALLPPLTIALAGYAIEAAGTRFVGSSAARPPAALVEASALGLVRVCGATSVSAEAMRTACGVGPRDPATLDWSRLALEPAFLQSGLPAALGFPSTISLASSGLRLALALTAAALGLWIAARAIGRGLLGRRRQAAGLASLRQGLIRVAALVVTAAVAAAVTHRIAIPAEAVPALAAAALLLALARLWKVRQVAAAQASSQPPPAPSRGRRRSAQSQPT